MLNAGTDRLSVGVAQKKPRLWINLTQALCELLVGFVCLVLLLAMLIAALDL